MTGDEQSVERVKQNAGRCDICGKLIDMEHAGHTLVVSDPITAPDDIKEEHGTTDQDAADAVADALEEVGDSPENHELTKVIREQREYKSHKSCLGETAMDKLEVPA